MVTGSGCPSKLAASSSVNNVGQTDALRIGDIGESEVPRGQQRRKLMGLCVGVGRGQGELRGGGTGKSREAPVRSSTHARICSDPARILLYHVRMLVVIFSLACCARVPRNIRFKSLTSLLHFTKL